MGRRRQSHLELPPHMYLKRGRYYYGRAGIALGPDFGQALRRYAELHGGTAGPGTFAEAARRYTREELPKKSPKTQAEYERQLGTLVRVFGRCPLAGDSIRPRDVHGYLAATSARSPARSPSRSAVRYSVCRQRERSRADFGRARGQSVEAARSSAQLEIRYTATYRGFESLSLRQ